MIKTFNRRNKFEMSLNAMSYGEKSKLYSVWEYLIDNGECTPKQLFGEFPNLGYGDLKYGVEEGALIKNGRLYSANPDFEFRGQQNNKNNQKVREKEDNGETVAFDWWRHPNFYDAREIYTVNKIRFNKLENAIKYVEKNSFVSLYTTNTKYFYFRSSDNKIAIIVNENNEIFSYILKYDLKEYTGEKFYEIANDIVIGAHSSVSVKKINDVKDVYEKMTNGSFDSFINKKLKKYISKFNNDNFEYEIRNIEYDPTNTVINLNVEGKAYGDGYDVHESYEYFIDRFSSYGSSGGHGSVSFDDCYNCILFKNSDWERSVPYLLNSFSKKGWTGTIPMSNAFLTKSITFKIDGYFD